MKISHVLAVGVVVAVVGTGVAVATTGASNTSAPSVAPRTDSIAACVDRKTGAVRIFRDGKCRAGEKVMRWAVRGPAGPQGPAGSGGGGGGELGGYIDEPDEVSVPNTGVETVTLTSSTLPAASYIATYTAGAQVALGVGVMSCRLKVDGATEALADVRMGVGTTTVAMTGAFTAGPNTPQATVSCTSDIDTVLVNQTLTMVQVAWIETGQQPSCPRSEAARRC